MTTTTPALTPAGRALVRRLQAARLVVDEEFRLGNALAAADQAPDLEEFERAQRHVWRLISELAALGYDLDAIDHHIRKGPR